MHEELFQEGFFSKKEEKWEVNQILRTNSRQLDPLKVVRSIAKKRKESQEKAVFTVSYQPIFQTNFSGIIFFVFSQRKVVSLKESCSPNKVNLSIMKHFFKVVPRTLKIIQIFELLFKLLASHSIAAVAQLILNVMENLKCGI